MAFLTKYLADGEYIDYTPGADVAAGAVVVQGELVGIATRPILSGILGAIAMTGVFSVPKTAGGSTAIAVGAKVYWDATNQVATTSTASGANKAMGHVVLANLDADTSLQVRLAHF